MPLEVLRASLESMGLARAAPDELIREDELEVVPLLQLVAATANLDLAWTTRVGRAYADGLRLIAKVENEAYHARFELPVLEAGADQRRAMELASQMSGQFSPLIDRALMGIYRRQQELDRRLHLASRLRQLVVCPPLGQGLPLWVDDLTFDLANHVRAVQVAAPGGEQELLALCDRLGLRLLDRTRPLWELWLVTGLAHGRVGLLFKLHHAVAAALARLRHPGRLAAQARVLAGAWRMVQDGWRPPRRSPLRRPVGGRRRLVLARARLAVVKDIAHAHHATVNDVLLAAVAGGLRALLLGRGVPVAGLTLRASVPVALRAQAAAAALGNHVGLMVVPLPVTEPDPVRRLRRITQATTQRKRRPEVLAGLRPVGSLTVLWALNRYSRHQHLVDLFVTNVPGPQVPLFVVGARLLEAFPVVQVAGNVPLSVAVLSYDGQLNLGVQSDPDALPDVEVFADGLRRSLEELAAATRPLPG